MGKRTKQKLQDRSTVTGWGWVWIVCGLAVAGFAAILILTKPETPKKTTSLREHQAQTSAPKSSEEAWVVNIRQITDKLYAQAAEPRWLFGHEPGFSPAELQFTVNLTDRIAQQFDEALNRNLGIPEVRELKQMFGGKFYVTVFTRFGGGATRKVLPTREEWNPKNGQEIVLYGMEDFSHSEIQQHLLFYKHGSLRNGNFVPWKAVVTAAIDWPNLIWFDAFANHELLHAKYSREGNPTSTAPMWSDPWIAEELLAHRLEERIIDTRTKGRYKQLVGSIVERRLASDPFGFVGQLTYDDFKNLDNLFRPTVKAEADLRSVEYLFSLFSEWLRRHVPKEELETRTVEAYRKTAERLGGAPK